MSSEARSWQKVAAKLRRAMGLCPPTAAEADRAVREAGEVPMSAEEIENIVNDVTRGKVQPAAFSPDHAWTDEVETGSMAEDSECVLNRNAGEADEEVDREIERLREEALADEDDEDDEGGLAGGGGQYSSRP